MMTPPYLVIEGGCVSCSHKFLDSIVIPIQTLILPLAPMVRSLKSQLVKTYLALIC